MTRPSRRCARRRRAAPATATLAAVVGAVLLAGCTTTPQPIPGGSTEASSPEAPPPTPGPRQLSMVPIPDGRIDSAVDHLDDAVRRVFDSTDVPGMAVAVVHGGKTVFARGYGRADASAGNTGPAEPAGSAGAVGPDTVFPLGGISGAVSATVAATQLTGGRSWSTPIRQLLPQFAVSAEYVSAHATLGDAFSGALGLPAGAGLAAAQLGADRQTLLDRLHALGDSPFRLYSDADDLGPTIGSAALAHAAGSDWAGLASRALFAPLQMSSTTARAARPDPGGRDAAPQVRIDGTYQKADRSWTDAVAPSVGIRSTVSDMAVWMATVLAGGKHGGTQVIPAAPLTTAVSAHTVVSDPADPSDPFARDTRPVDRGFGFDVSVSPGGRVVLSATGAVPSGSGSDTGPDAALTLIPSADIGIVTLTNAVATPGNRPTAAETVNAEFLDEVQFGESTRDWSDWLRAQHRDSPPQRVAPAPPPDPAADSAPPSAPPPLTGYDGVYRNAFFGDARVRTSSDTTTLTVGPGRVRFRLSRIDGDVFAVTPLASGNPDSGTSSSGSSVGQGAESTTAAPGGEDDADAAETAGGAAADSAAAASIGSAAFRARYPHAYVRFDGDDLTISFADQAGVFRR